VKQSTAVAVLSLSLPFSAVALWLLFSLLPQHAKNSIAVKYIAICRHLFMLMIVYDIVGCYIVLRR
jgi:hypothetical protein